VKQASQSEIAHVLQYAVAGIQAGAHGLYSAREQWRQFRGQTFGSVNRV